MAAQVTLSPFPIFTDVDGNPLEDGYVYIGDDTLDPETNPKNVYWDEALTELVTQPIRTKGGYPLNSGAAARVYVSGRYSITTKNKNEFQINTLLSEISYYSQTETDTLLAAKLNSSDIGVTVQAYDADTAKTDIAQTFTEAQRTSTTAGDNSIAFNDSNHHSLTATSADITVTNQTIDQDGRIIISSAENITGWGIEFDWGNAGVPSGLTGVETFGYSISGASGADSIKIGRL